MAWSLRLWALQACALVAAGGLAAGAWTQREVFLHIHAQALADSDASGNLVVLTAFAVAAATGMAGFLLSHRPPRTAWRPALGLAVATYLLTVTVQSAYPFHVTLVERRLSVLAINPMISNHAGYASALLAPYALVLAALLLGGLCLRRLLARGTGPERVLGEQVAAACVAAPFLIVAAIGCLQVLGGVASQGGPVALHAPLAAVAAICVALLATAGLKTWRLAAYAGEAGPLHAARWRRLGRLEAVLFGAMAALAVLYTFLPPLHVDGLSIGTTFGLRTRGHLQFVFFALAAAHLPHLVVHRRALDAFHGRTAAAPSPLMAGTYLTALLAAAITAAVAGTLAFFATEDATGLANGALWPWLLALTPLAFVALRHGTPGLGAVPMLLCAVTLWGLGNTVSAVFDGFAQVRLVERTDPEILSLWRIAAALALGAAVFRGVQGAARLPRPSVQWPLAAGLAFCAAAIVLLVMPLGAWVVSGATQGTSVGIGSVLAAQDNAVQIVIFALSGAAALLAAGLTARLLRPDWFQRPPPEPSPTGAAA